MPAEPALVPVPAAPAGSARTWTGLTHDSLPVAEAQAWVDRPDCGGIVCFTGVVRDHADGRDGVEQLTYEAYEQAAEQRMDEIAVEARRRWPDVGRVAILHRVGDLAVGDPAVVVAVSAPHRAEAFEAARWCIDTVKDAVPIWKRERWAGGEGWGTDAAPIADAVVEPVADPAAGAGA